MSREAPLCICTKANRASFTVEAAVIVPLVAACLATLLFFFRIMQIETDVYLALCYASRQTAAIESLAETPVAELAIAQGYFVKAINDSKVAGRYMESSTKFTALRYSNVSDDYIDLIADYRIPLPIQFFSVKNIHIRQESKSRKWTGANISNSDLEDCFVYVTEYGSVYHISKSCNYLDLSIRTTSKVNIPALRNKNGHKYYSCERCAANNSTINLVYITDYGTLYHATLQCRGLKRSVVAIPKSEVGDKRGCTKCAK